MVPRVVALVRTTECAERIQDILNDEDVSLEVVMMDDASVDIEGIPQRANAILIDADLAPDGVIEEIASFRQQLSGHTGLIVLAENHSSESVRALFRLGVSDVLPQPIDASELLAALNTVSQAAKQYSSSQPTKGRIAVVLGAGGGVGATTIAVNMAAVMSKSLNEKEADAEEKEIALLDLDLQYGSAAVAMDMEPEVRIPEIASAGNRLDASFLKACMTRHASGVFVLAAPSEIAPFSLLSPQLIEQIFDLCRRNFAVTVVDLPLAWCNWTPTVLQEADLINLVFTPTLEGASRMLRIFDTLEELELATRPQLLVCSRITKTLAAKDRIDALNRVLSRSIDVQVREDQGAMEQLAAQGKIAAETPDGRLAQDILELSKRNISMLELSPRRKRQAKKKASLFDSVSKLSRWMK